MDIFRKNKAITTSGLYLGKPEAEAENISKTQNLLTFFEDYQNINDNIINNGNFIISGRKGSGKSAFAGWLIEKSLSDNNIYCSMVKKNEFDLETMIQAIPQNDTRFEALFEWIILVRIVKQIIDSGIGTYLKEYRALEDFYSKNTGLVDIDRYVISEILSNKEVNFSPLKKNFNFFSSISNKSIKAPFFQIITPLRETVCKVLKMDIYKDIRFYVLFDDLDVKFKLNRDNDRTMLMDLIRTARRYNTEYFVRTSAKVLIFMRDDIAERLEGVDCDKNKIFGSYEYKINWYEHDIAVYDEKSVMLRKFINKRLSIGLQKLGIKYNEEDPWVTFVQEDVNAQKSTFKYILDHTFYLPRDIISVFKNIGSKNYRLPLTNNEISTLLKEFSKTKKREIVDELTVLYEKDEIDRIFRFLEEVYNGWDVTYEQIQCFLNENNLQEIDFQNILDYSLLIPVDRNGRMYFNYREQVVTSNFQTYTYRTPKILSLYFSQRI